MTERLPSANKQAQILDEVRQLAVMVNEKISAVREDIAEVKIKVEMQPQIDKHQFEGLKNDNISCQRISNARFVAIEERVEKQENNTTWLVRTVIGEVIGIVFLAILAIAKFL